jgi:hypothetical protein
VTLASVVSPDSKGRFALKRWVNPGVRRWKVFVQDDGRKIVLEAEGSEQA